jgi:hypothetical protein
METHDARSDRPDRLQVLTLVALMGLSLLPVALMWAMMLGWWLD